MALITLITAGVLAATAVTGGAGTSLPGGHRQPTAGASVAAAGDNSCSSDWTHGFASVDMTIQNNTGFPLTYDAALSGPSSGHWNQRPLTTLKPGQCEVVNAYTNSAIDTLALNVVYTTPWGDTMPFMGNAAGTTNSINPNVFIGTPTWNAKTQTWRGAIDSRYSIGNQSIDGTWHLHYAQYLS